MLHGRPSESRLAATTYSNTNPFNACLLKQPAGQRASRHNTCVDRDCMVQIRARDQQRRKYSQPDRETDRTAYIAQSGDRRGEDGQLAPAALTYQRCRDV